MSIADDLGEERLLKRFEQAWQSGPPPVLDEYLPDDPDQRLGVLVELVHLDLEFHIKGGTARRVEDYLQRYPELTGTPDVLRDLIRAEWDQRRRREPNLHWDEYRVRFPGVVPNQPPSSSGYVTPRGLAPGSRLGKYVLGEVLGRGAFGVVYCARDTELDRTVAVKVPRPGNLVTPQDADRFLREARNAAQLRHPRLVALHDAGQAGGTFFLVSAYVSGQTLAQRLQAGRLPLRDAVELVAAVANAIHYAHAQGVIHRDLKPSNIIMDEAGRPNVTDFGLARRAGADATLTREGEMLGTPAYMSPEQARGESHHVDGRTDVYSLGVILYELLAGDLPFRGTAAMVVQQVLNEEPRSVRRLNECVPRDLETICTRAMAKEPARRYQTAGLLAADLRRWLAGEPVRARRLGPLQRGWRWCRRKPVVAGLLAAILGLILAGCVGVTWQWRRARVQQHRAEQSVVTASEILATWVSLGDNGLRFRSGMMPAHRLALDQTVRLYEDLLQQRGPDPTIEFGLAAAALQLGIHMGETGRASEAVAACTRAATLFQKSWDANPANMHPRIQLGATKIYLGNLHLQNGKFDEAVVVLQQAVALWKRLVEEAPSNIWWQRNLAVSFSVLGDALLEKGQLAAARREFELARAIQERLARDQATVYDHTVRLASNDYRVGEFHARAGRPAEALPFLEAARNVRADAVRARPEDIFYRRDLARTDLGLARARHALGQRASAVANLTEARKTLEALVRDNPGVTDFRANLAAVQYFEACLHYEEERPQAARVCLEQAARTYEHILSVNPDNGLWPDRLHACRAAARPRHFGACCVADP